MSGEANMVFRPDLEELISRLSPEEKQLIASSLLSQIDVETKTKIISKELGESGLVVVVGGSNCSIRSDVSLQTQSASNLDITKILEALAQRIRG